MSLSLSGNCLSCGLPCGLEVLFPISLGWWWSRLTGGQAWFACRSGRAARRESARGAALTPRECTAGMSGGSRMLRSAGSGW